MKNGTKKVMLAFGTRPEAIKMAPVIKQFESQIDKFVTIVCATAQHRHMLDQVLKLFEITTHHDLDVMTPNQTLPDLTAKILLGVTSVLEKERPDIVFVQGDTTTTLVTGLAAYYLKIPVAHIEAGLRTRNKYSPFPEEVNRRLTSTIADFHFTPTQESKNNLLREGFPENKIFITGNTVIDALHWVNQKINSTTAHRVWSEHFQKEFNLSFSSDIKTILVTGHRRESFGEGFERICHTLARIAFDNSDVKIVYPVHLNPNVQKTVTSILANVANVHLIPPLEYEPFVYLMNKSYLILTDSGGVQEEAPSLGKPVLVMRDTTERPEGLNAGVTKLVGTDCDKTVQEVSELLHNTAAYEKMSKAVNPYGDGTASKIIVKSISNALSLGDIINE